MDLLTRFVLVLVLSIPSVSFVHSWSLIRAACASQKPSDYKTIEERFPTAEYNEQNLKDVKRTEKQRRYNIEGRLVFAKLEPWMTASVLYPEPHFTFPQLPVTESDIVVVGTVGTGQAHLSENKRSVFSEFVFVVEDVFKSTISGIVRGSTLTIDRVGGHVKYSNGQRVLYTIAGLNAPQSGARYLFFLTSNHNKEDISILTGYELAEGCVTPLDELPQVRSLLGSSEAEVVQRVRELIQNSALSP